MQTSIFKVKIPDKVYTKEELIKVVTETMNETLEDDTNYKYKPKDYDNFYTEYEYKKDD